MFIFFALRPTVRGMRSVEERGDGGAGEEAELLVDAGYGRRTAAHDGISESLGRMSDGVRLACRVLNSVFVTE